MQITTGSVVDRYTVEGVLGEGGMAMVYRVRHNQLGTYHALKVLTIASRQIAARLLQEGRVQATLRHPNIVAVTDIVDLSGSPGLIMELINGPSLDDFLVREQLSIEQVDALASGILAGVVAAHAQDLIHRDLKPANIMLAITPSGLVPKVTDFGLAKILRSGGSSSNTRTGSTMGTPHYMSPEQIRDSKNVGPKADVFSLGAILYEMIAGRRAFDGDDLLAIFNAVATGDFVPIGDLRADIPERMERAINGALEVEQDNRIASVAELLAVWGGDAAPAVQVIAGPWDAEVMAKASSMSVAGPTSSSLSNPLPSGATANQWPTRALPTTPSEEEPSVPDSAELDISLGSPPTSSDSLVNARSLLIGVGSTAAVFGIGGLLVLTLAVAGFVAYRTSVVEVDPPSSSPIEASAVAGDPEDPGDEPLEVAPKPSPKPRRAAASGTPAPEGEEGGEDPEAEEEAEGEEEALEGVDEAAEGEEEADAGEEEALEDTDVVADIAEEPEEEQVEPGDPRSRLPPDLRSQSTGVRLDGLGMRESQTDVTWIYDIVVRHDPHSEVRKKAWRIVQTRWKKGIGPRGEHQIIAVWMLGTGTADQRVEAIGAVARSGSDVTLLKASLGDGRSVVRRAAVDGIAAMARRTGQTDPSRIMLNELKKTETDAKTIKKIDAALESI